MLQTGHTGMHCVPETKEHLQGALGHGDKPVLNGECSYARRPSRELMRALRFTAPGAACAVELDPPARSATEALVSPRYAGLCGTDLELFTGVMPYFATGVASYPIQPGHEVAGTVVEGGDLPPGTEVMIDPVFGCGRVPRAPPGSRRAARTAASSASAAGCRAAPASWSRCPRRTSMRSQVACRCARRSRSSPA